MLCSTCTPIDLTAYFSRAIHAARTASGTVLASAEALRLGTLLEIYDRYSQCEFCRLIFEAITHRGARDEWRSKEWLLSQAQKLGDKGQCVIYSYRFANSRDRQEACGDSKWQEGYRIAIELLPREAWGGTRSELALVRDIVKENDDRPLFSGRSLRPENVDIELAKRWLHVCRTQHGSACEIPAHDATTAVPDSTPRDLLVIDVQELKLCALPKKEQYIALSYCWPYGAETTFLTTKAVYKDLLKPGGLEERLSSLTAVVRDAISFVREFGQRYLWVDALCIIQDDLEYKMSQIQQMDLVYGAALMTIICADSQERPQPRDPRIVQLQPAHEIFPGIGLTGYRPGSRICLQITGKVGNLTLAVPLAAVDVSVSYSRWNTRAWTFQEYALARRKLYFTDLQLYFQCSCAVFAEDTVGEAQAPNAYNYAHTTLYNSADTKVPIDCYAEIAWVSRSPVTDPIQAIHTYRMLHYQYSDRNMTNPGDVVFAFQGVITILSRTLETDFIAGLPERYFHEALLWISMGEFALRSVHKEDVKRVFPYPSWTWAGWRSRTTYNLVFTAMGMGDDDTYLVGEAEWFLTDSTAVWKLDTPTMHDITREKWGDRVSTLGPGPVPTSIVERLKPRSGLVLDNGFWNPSLQLASWTRTAHFRITGDSYPLNGYGGRDSWATKNVKIFDRNGKAAGSILLRKEAIQHLLSEGDVHEFVLLSRSLQLTKLVSFFDEDVFPRRDWCYVSVMLVGEGRERDLGAVGRFGVGVVHEDAWVAAQPNPKWVVFQ